MLIFDNMIPLREFTCIVVVWQTVQQLINNCMEINELN